MKITIDRLKQIIKEELEAAEQPDKLSGFTRGATQRTKTNVNRAQVQAALDALAAEIEKMQSVEQKAKTLGIIIQKLGIAPDELLKITNLLRTKD
tara:strand:+ start:525 stop:809 length:285 start_codon:yes stop_codon:yes gene_type:complete